MVGRLGRRHVSDEEAGITVDTMKSRRRRCRRQFDEGAFCRHQFDEWKALTFTVSPQAL